MQTLNLKQLEAFCAVVERGSFTAAAEALYLAQSTVSGHILALEKDIGVPLLVRSGKRRITLTEEGRRVYDHAHTILQSCAELSASWRSRPPARYRSRRRPSRCSISSRSSSASFTGKTRISAFCSAAATAPPSTPPYCRAKRTSASSARC